MNQRHRTLLGVVMLGAHAGLSAAAQWPFDPTDVAPPVGVVLGDFDSANLHRGIDMPRTVYTTVFAVEGGCVWVNDRQQGDPDEQSGAISITPATPDCVPPSGSEGWGYSHVINSFNLKDKNVVSAGQPIGAVANFAPGRPLDAFDHLHLGRVDAALQERPAHPFQYFTGSLPLEDPILDPNKIFLVRDKTFNASGFPTLATRTVIHGDIDIIAEAHTKIINESRPGVYSISFAVLQTPPGASTIPERTLARFSAMTTQSSVAKAPLVYEPTQTTDFRGHYVVTNAGTNAPGLADGVSNVIENAWFTKVRQGISDASGGLGANDMARFNGEAKYKDGPYEVSVKVGTFQDAKTLTRQKSVLVDNFRPFLTQTTIGSEGQYARAWSWDGTRLSSPAPTSNRPIRNGDHPITLVFSEPVESPVVSFDGSGISVQNLASGEPAGNRRTFSGTLSIGAAATDGNKTMNVQAADPAGNLLLSLGPNDVTIDPATQLTRNAAGTMQGVGGPDTSVNIIRKRPSSLDEPA